MDNQLPSEFDLVILGTGMIESILSAATSRIGKTVLHIDSRDYYGGQWASFNLKTLHNFSPEGFRDSFIKDNTTDLTIDNVLNINNNRFDIRGFQTKWHIPENLHKNETDSASSKPDKELDEQQKEMTNKVLAETNVKQEETKKLLYTQESMLKDSRRFNIDLAPKLHFARGDFVQLLISSNIARYAEYRSVSRVLTWLNGQLEVVPCSRSDIFANNRVSVIEKRMLMKLLTSLDDHEDELKNYENKTFYTFLKDRKLTPNLIHYVLYAISQSEDTTPCMQGIENTKRFLSSLGRFGKTPFLFSMYGSGETTQAFCRLSAVFGGIFALNQSSLSGITIEGNKVKSLVNGEQKIKAEHFVLSAEQAPEKFVKFVQVKEYISRAVFITDRSIMPSEQEHLTLLMYPPENGKNIVTIMEMGTLTGTCPKSLFLAHLTSRQVQNPQEDFKHVVDNLFETKTNFDTELNKKPHILWSCYFSLPDSSSLSLNEHLPANLYLCGGPDLDLDYDLSIKKAKEIFMKVYPDFEFLPRAPDPEDIIIGNDGEQSPSEPFSSSETINKTSKDDADE